MKVYEKNGYRVTETEWIRIGTSKIYIFERTEEPLNSPEEKFRRIVVGLYSMGGTCEIDSHELPDPTQAAELVKFFSQYM